MTGDGGRRAIPGSELIAAKPAIDRDDGAGDIACLGRGEEHGERGEIFRFAPIANRDLLLREFLTKILRIVAADLLAHASSGRNAVYGDAVLADLARESFRPGMYCGLGGKCCIQSLRFGFSG